MCSLVQVHTHYLAVTLDVLVGLPSEHFFCLCSHNPCNSTSFIVRGVSVRIRVLRECQRTLQECDTTYSSRAEKQGYTDNLINTMKKGHYKGVLLHNFNIQQALQHSLLSRSFVLFSLSRAKSETRLKSLELQNSTVENWRLGNHSPPRSTSGLGSGSHQLLSSTPAKSRDTCQLFLHPPHWGALV